MKEKDKKIDVESPSGFRDYLPEEMIPRNEIIKKITGVFECFGFLPLDTPAVEKEEVLTAGDESFNKQIFKLSTTEGKEKGLALRFDLTVPLARVMALRQSYFSKPFKRYQIGKAWRGERPQAGRYREFIQCDADIIGAESMLADAEIISLMYETMVSLGIDNFSIRINNKKILEGLCECVGFDKKKNSEVLRTIDKLDKKSWSGVTEELEEIISKKQITALRDFLEIHEKTQIDTLNKAEDYLKKSVVGMEGIRELKEITGILSGLGVDGNKWTIDFSVARGLGYYTGPIFETILNDIPGIGSVFSGGRYDKLISKFGGQDTHATGASLGLDRLYSALEKLNIIQKKKSVTKVLVLNFDEKARLYNLEIVSRLRRAGIESEFYFGQEKSLRGQISYALKHEIPYIVIAGEDEMKKEVVQIKDLKNSTQTEIKETALLSFFNKNIR